MVVFCLALAWLAGAVARGEPAPGSPTTVKLVNGDTLSGRVGPVQDGEVTILTDYGAVRVPVAKISGESQAALGITGSSAAGNAGEVAALRARVRELEELVARLRAENAAMRQTPAVPAVSAGGGAAATGVARPGGVAEPAAVASGYRLSSTGKRHNSRCRYFLSNGRACGPDEGVACKVCGG